MLIEIPDDVFVTTFNVERENSLSGFKADYMNEALCTKQADHPVSERSDFEAMNVVFRRIAQHNLDYIKRVKGVSVE